MCSDVWAALSAVLAEERIRTNQLLYLQLKGCICSNRMCRGAVHTKHIWNWPERGRVADGSGPPPVSKPGALSQHPAVFG